MNQEKNNNQIKDENGNSSKPLLCSVESNRGFTLGKTEFLGFQYTDKDGNKEIIKPCESIKKDVEKYLDERNGVNAT